MPSIVMNLADMANLARRMHATGAEYDMLGRRLQGFRVPGLPRPRNYAPEAAVRSVGSRLRSLAVRITSQARQLDTRWGIASRHERIPLGIAPGAIPGMVAVRNGGPGWHQSEALTAADKPALQGIPQRSSSVTILPTPTSYPIGGGYTLSPTALFGHSSGVVTLQPRPAPYTAGAISLAPQVSRPTGIAPLTSPSPGLTSGGIVLGGGAHSGAVLLPQGSGDSPHLQALKRDLDAWATREVQQFTETAARPSTSRSTSSLEETIINSAILSSMADTQARINATNQQSAEIMLGKDLNLSGGIGDFRPLGF